MRQSTFKEALDINFIALKIVEKLGDESKQATILGNVGNLYYELEQNKSAELFFRKDLDQCQRLSLEYDFLIGQRSRIINVFIQLTSNLNPIL